MFDRRKFLKLFAAGSAGLTVAGQIALADDIKNWMLSPQKTIFIPPEKKIIERGFVGVEGQQLPYILLQFTDLGYEFRYAK